MLETTGSSNLQSIHTLLKCNNRHNLMQEQGSEKELAKEDSVEKVWEEVEKVWEQVWEVQEQGDQELVSLSGNPSPCCQTAKFCPNYELRTLLPAVPHKTQTCHHSPNLPS